MDEWYWQKEVAWFVRDAIERFGDRAQAEFGFMASEFEIFSPEAAEALHDAAAIAWGFCDP